MSDAVFGDIVALPGFSEPVSSLSHYLGAALVVALGPSLLRAARCDLAWLRAVAFFLFGAVLLFAMSGTYHLLEPGGEPRAVLQRLDHAAIWVLIAGTFTAMHIVGFRTGLRRWGVLSVVWAVAAIGIVLKTMFFDVVNEAIGLVLYLGLGWMGVLTAVQLARRDGRRSITLIIAGGVCYSVGAVLEFARWPILVPHVVGPHELFHVAVIAGLGCHAWLVRNLLRDRAAEARAIPAAAQGAQASSAIGPTTAVVPSTAS